MTVSVLSAGLLVGVEPGGRVLGGWFGTLLGPEGSGRPRIDGVGSPAVWWGLCGWLLCPPFAASAPVGAGVGLVGLLFEICIVDASIFVAIVLLCL